MTDHLHPNTFAGCWVRGESSAKLGNIINYLAAKEGPPTSRNSGFAGKSRNGGRISGNWKEYERHAT